MSFNNSTNYTTYVKNCSVGGRDEGNCIATDWANAKAPFTMVQEGCQFPHWMKSGQLLVPRSEWHKYNGIERPMEQCLTLKYTASLWVLELMIDDHIRTRDCSTHPHNHGDVQSVNDSMRRSE